MEGVDKRSRMSKMFSPMKPLLVKELEYNGITLFGDDLLIGQAENMEVIEKFTQAYLDKLGSVKGYNIKGRPSPF